MEEAAKPKKLLFGRDIEGPYNRIEFPTKRPVIRRGPTRTRDLTGDERGYRYEKKDRFAGEIDSDPENPEAGRLFKSTRANRIDPEPNRTLTGVRNPMGRPAGVYEQRRAAETGDAAAYWSSVAKRGASSDIEAKNNVGGFCTNCDAAIPDVEAAIPKENKPRYVPVYGGPGKPARQQLVGRGSGKVEFEAPTRDDTLCATCTPVASAVTSSGQQAIAEQFMVRRARG